MLHEQSVAGGHAYPNGLTAQTLRHLVLDDHCPWELFPVGGGLSVERMKFNAGPVHDVQLAAPMHVIWSHHQKAKDDRHAIELAVCTSYMGGYHRFTTLAISKEEELLQSEHPLIKYYCLAIDQFNGVAFGDPQVGCINPTGVKFVETFINDGGKAIEVLVDGIVALLEWINETVRTADFHQPCEH
jgi:hypothetical protein